MVWNVSSHLSKNAFHEMLRKISEWLLFWCDLDTFIPDIFVRTLAKCDSPLIILDDFTASLALPIALWHLEKQNGFTSGIFNKDLY